METSDGRLEVYNHKLATKINKFLKSNTIDPITIFD